VIRVLIVDDHTVVRAGLRLLLEREEDIEPVGEAGDADEALRLARRLTPDVVLMDVVMPGMTGVDAAAEIRHAVPGARILMLSMQDDPSYVRAAGEQYVHPSLGAKLVAPSQTPARGDDPLSEREREVLSLLALGYTNQEIADRLVVSVRTVEAHRAHILNKLRLSTRAELVRYAIDTGLLETR